jgi:transposase
MKKKQTKRTRVTELTPEVLNQLDAETLIGIVMKLYEQNKQLSEQIQTLIHEKYGPKTERHEDPGQLRIFQSPDETTPQNVANEEEQKKTPPKKPGHTRNPKPSHLTTKQIRRKPTEAEQVCQCGAHRRKVNEVVRNTRFECIPARLYVEEIIDEIWQCVACNDSIVVAASPIEPIPNGNAGPQLLCEIAEDRWMKHMPYHRQEQAFARQGVDIARSTMCGWMNALAKIYRRVYDALTDELLMSRIIATDDTPVKVQDRTKKSNIRRGHEWIFMGDREHPVNVFHYTQGRSRAGPKKFIPGFKGFLQGDCFSGNRALCAESGATLVACRSHDRRYYKKARPNNKQSADQMLTWYQALFEIEQTARDLNLSNSDIILLRQQEAVPILDKMKKWLDQEVVTALPASSFGKAVSYSLNNWDVLNNYLLDGELRIDNNLAEQEMKRFATGRKNWYFFGSDESGETASIMLSLFSTCLRNGVEPRAYMLDTLQRLTANPDCDIEPLLPHRWKPQAAVPEIEGTAATPQIEYFGADR